MFKRWLIDAGLYCVFWFVKGVVALRYRVRIVGLENLPQKGGILFLPNHPAEMEPVILMVALWRKFKLRPLVVEQFYYLKYAYFFMQCVKALPLPDIERGGNRWKVKEVETLLHTVSEELKKGGNFLIYPAGKLKLGELEVIGGASFVHNVLKACPDATVVLIRTTGLWGSSFSRALTGKVPDFWKTTVQGIRIIFKNGLFFTPRREVSVEMEVASGDFPFGKPRLVLNRYLEEWYNKKPDPLKLVSYFFLKEQVPKVAEMKVEKKDEKEIRVSPEIEGEIKTKIALLSKRPKEQIRNEMNLSLDLGLDSLDIAQIYFYLDQYFERSDLEHGELQTVADVLVAASCHRAETADTTQLKKSKAFWPKEKNRRPPTQITGKTIQEAFLQVCLARKSEVAIADAMSGVLRYKKLKLSALVLSKYIEELEGEKIGILLPSSVGAYICIMATLLANKVPVMLNWTAGKRSLEHASNVTKLSCVLTSRKFLDRLDNGDITPIENKLLLLENVKHQITLKHKLKALFSGKKEYKEEDTAVILFTSGTESLPKAVPLTHRNILSNQNAALSCVNFKANDLMYGILPPFHSFGFSVTGLLPILAGLKVFYAPDPTDSRGMANDIAHFKPTLFCAAPSFIVSVFKIARLEDLKSVRLIVTGAEKAPQELLNYIKELKADFIEGYGITECAPIVTLTRPGEPIIGVGKPLPGIELRIIEENEICIHGPNVFKGYLANNINPFIEIDGKKWYRSGDMGKIDPDGSLILLGRLKRFVKIGGEMVSLAGLEEEIGLLTSKPIAISAREPEGGKPELILFATTPLDKEEVNAALAAAGYGRIVKISQIKQIKEIPLTGTGKTHYRLLDEM